MSKLKPYLFWIICGIIVLVELVLLVFYTPTSKDGHGPVEVKSTLDSKNQELDKLFLQAKAGSPAGREFDAENDKDIKELTGNWLATPAWKPVLEGHVAEYSSQLIKIRDYLVSRSQPLRKPISTSTVKFDWYNAYASATAELLQKLADNHCLVMRSATAAGQAAPQSARPQGGAAPAPGDPSAGDAAEAAPDFTKAAGPRSTAGFLTTTQYPDADRFDELTTQYRVMELVASALIDSKGTNEVSPIAPAKTTFEAHAQLAGTAWKDANTDAITVQITLQGPLTAVMAAEAALEENRDDALPIKVVTGVALSRKSFVAGERRDITSEPVVLKVTLAVLDFSSKANEVFVVPKDTPVAPSKPKKPKAASAEAGAGAGEEP